MDPLKIPSREWTALEEFPESLWNQWQARRVARVRRARVALTLALGFLVGGGGLFAHSHRAGPEVPGVVAMTSAESDEADIEADALAFATGQDPTFAAAPLEASSFPELADNELTDSEL